MARNKYYPKEEMVAFLEIVAHNLTAQGTTRAGPLRKEVVNTLFNIYKGQWEPLLPLAASFNNDYPIH